MASDPSTGGFLSAREAAERLGVTLPTLYAYVSRGFVRSETMGNQRSRRYRAEDVETLIRRKEAREEPSRAVEESLHWGMPVLESGLTLIADGDLYYRGHGVVDLARTHSLEEVAGLLWLDSLTPPRVRPWAPTSERWRRVSGAVSDLSPIERFQVLLPLAGIEDPTAYDLRPESLAHTGLRITRLLAAIATHQSPTDAPVARTLQEGWLPDRPDARRLLEMALVLAADHELNVSAFTARCVASAGSSAYSVIQAGLAALQGARHGGHCDRVEALFREAGSAERATATLQARLRRGEEIPGFGPLPLYSGGDPRGRELIAAVQASCPDSPDRALGLSLAEAALEVLGEHPTIDFGLVLLCRALGLPDGTAIALFALGRSVGWMAHAIEQAGQDRLIRPRARYVGRWPHDVERPLDRAPAAPSSGV